jgi:hypothetical protein
MLDDDDNLCTAAVQFEHSSGCPVFNFDPFLKGCGLILALGGISIGLGKLTPYVVVAIFQVMIFILICSIALKRGWFDLFDMFGDGASLEGWFWALIGFGLAFKIALVIGWLIRKAA